MAKDPAFLFYSSDFLTGTMVMSFEDRGKYITILSYMHQNGRLSEETIRLLVGNVSDTLRLKFSVDKKGFWFNDRLEFEVEKRRNFIESRHENGKKGGRPRKKQEESPKPIGYPTENLVEDVNIITNEDEYNLTNASKKILTDFGFNEVTGINKLRQIKEALNFIFKTGRIEYFTDQYENYMRYKIEKQERIHGIENFFDLNNQYQNPGWDSNTWSKLLTHSPTKKDKMSSTVEAFANTPNPFKK